MERMFALDNPIQRYAWGSRTAIPALLGRPAPGPGEPPWAELWMGAHPSAPSRVEMSGRAIGLDQLAAQHPHEVLGARVARAHGPRLPFLFKIIAAERPLSIQCHPDAAAARAGFERENRLGVALDARERSYRDASHKPELLVALGAFSALVGFRSPREIRDRLAAAGARQLAGAVSALDQPRGLASFLASLLRLPAAGRRGLLDQVAVGLAGDVSAEAEWVRRLAADYPGDAAAVAPLFLNLVELEAGQGIYLGAGVLHSYLGGVGLEIMASSDNVLRGGLTDKHIDVDELIAIVRAEPMRPAVLTPSRGPLCEYATPAQEFRLGHVDLAQRAAHVRAGAQRGPEIVLSFADRCRLVDGETGTRLELQRGSAALITAQVTSYRVEGEGRVWIAGVP
ncbi:MAG TPA: mannose-6-phosphate isomerase, class I [Kofleriaceae bacterium]|nr:mannose-6-phosphate isomerase, class I [Kofleriaceae bacterium]